MRESRNIRCKYELQSFCIPDPLPGIRRQRDSATTMEGRQICCHSWIFQSLCDAKVPYMYSTLPYARKPEVIGANDYYVTGCDEYTKWLVNNFQIYGTLQGRNISLDRYFTSVTLAEWCLERNITIVGTLKSYRKGIPKEIKGVADREEKSTALCYSEDEKNNAAIVH